MNVLVTGAAGFIGFHVAQKLLARGDRVVGLDNLNDYYDVNLKLARLARIEHQPGFTFARLDLQDRPAMEALFQQHHFDAVINLAAQAGRALLAGEPARLHGQQHRGLHQRPRVLPPPQDRPPGLRLQQLGLRHEQRHAFSVHDNVDHPISLYAATKKANELMAHTYSPSLRPPHHGPALFHGVRPLGPAGHGACSCSPRPSSQGKPIEVFNHGQMQRDFTYIDDIVEGVVRVMDRTATPNPAWDGARPDPGTSSAPYRLYNIGNNNPVMLTDFIGAIEQALGRTAERELLPMQPGDVAATYANIDDLVADVGYRPQTPVQVGIDNFVAWYMEHMHKAAHEGKA